MLICKLGGYVSLRHNRVRDLEAELMKEVCHDVRECSKFTGTCTGSRDGGAGTFFTPVFGGAMTFLHR